MSALKSDHHLQESTHFSAVFFEKTATQASLYIYDPYYCAITVSHEMRDYLRRHDIKVYVADTARSYALNGTSFAYAIQDIEKLKQASSSVAYEIDTKKAGPPAFKLSASFKYNGLEMKRVYLQLLVDTAQEKTSDTKADERSSDALAFIV